MILCALTHASSVVVTPLASATRPRLTAHSANTIAAVARNVPARSAHAAASSSARTLRPLHLPPAAILCVSTLSPATHLLRSARRLASTGAVAPINPTIVIAATTVCAAPTATPRPAAASDSAAAATTATTAATAAPTATASETTAKSEDSDTETGLSQC